MRTISIKKCLLIFLIAVSLGVLAFTAPKAYAAEDEQVATSVTEPVTEEPVTDPMPEYGWTESDGKWSYTDENGTAYIGGMFTIGNNKYLFDKDGFILTGIQNSGSGYYFFSKYGDSPETGLGILVPYKGWKKIDSSIYYFNDNSSVATGWKTISGEKFYFANDGKMTTGWTKMNGKTLYFKKTGDFGVKGKLLTGWKRIKENTYYFAPDGKDGAKGSLATGFKKIGKNTFYFRSNGKDGDRGALQTGWQKVGKYRYFLQTSGKRGVRGKLITNQIAGSKKLGYAYVDSKGRKVTTKAITLATKFVLAHTTSKQSKSEKLKACYDYLWKNYSYQRIYGLPEAKTLSKDFAEFMFKNKRGNCFCYGATYACIAKVLGYESRVGTGLIAAARGGMTAHGWAEVKIKGVWYLCDPDMQMEIPSRSAYMKARESYPYPLRTNNHYTLTFSKAKLVWKKGK